MDGILMRKLITRRALLAVALAGLILLRPALAQFGHPIGQTSYPATSGGGYAGPADVVSVGSTGECYSFRACDAAVAAPGTNKSFNLENVSSVTCDILITTSGGVGLTANCSSGGSNGETVNTFCASSGSCSALIAYGQINGFNATPSGTPPQVDLNCFTGSIPCIHGQGGGGTTGVLQSAHNFALSAPYTLYGVGERTSFFTNAQSMISFTGANADSGWNSTASTLSLTSDGTNFVTGSCTDDTWCIAQGIVNGSSSAIYVNGTNNTGTAGTSVTGGAVSFGSSLNGNWFEMMLVPNSTASGESTLCHNASAFLSLGAC
jgi:hypothetical protein